MRPLGRSFSFQAYPLYKVSDYGEHITLPLLSILISILSSPSPKHKESSYSPILLALRFATANFPSRRESTSVIPSYFSVSIGETYLTWKRIVIGEIDYALPMNSEVTTAVSIISPKEEDCGSMAKVSSARSQGSITIYSCSARRKPNNWLFCIWKGHSLNFMRILLEVMLVKTMVSRAP